MDLLRKKNPTHVSHGVKNIQHVKRGDAELHYIEFDIYEIEPGYTLTKQFSDLETCIVIVTGKATVETDGHTYTEIGTRESVFDQIPTDSVYVPSGIEWTVTANTSIRIAVCLSPGTGKGEVQWLKASTIKPEQRGENNNKRTVFNILPDNHPAAESLLVVEVITPSGNWSSYPPHKHDNDNLPQESLLEETYYHEMNPPQGFVFQRVYTDNRQLDELMAVENQDVVLVPKGYHPVAVPEGYTSYYLNVMAGPKRIWKFHNEEAHEWILQKK